LTFIGGEREVSIQKTGKKPIANNGFDGGHTNKDLATSVSRSINNGFSANLWLINRRYWLRLLLQPAFYPVELGSIHCRHLHHGDPNLALVVN